LRRSFPFVLAAAALATTSWAQPIQNVVLRNSFNPVGAGARGLGMGGAFIGVADDGSAASFNPAGLAQLRRSELALVGFRHAVETTVPNPDTGRTETEKSDHQAPDFFGLAVPFEVGGQNLTVQLSYQRSVDLFGKGRAFTRDTVPFRELRISQPGNARLSADILPEQSGAFHTLSAAAAYQLTPRLAVGGSINYWLADWTSEGTVSSRVNTIAAPGVPTILISSTNRTFRHEQSMNGASLNAGLLLRYPRLSIGAVLRMPFVGRYDLTESGQATDTQPGRAPVTTPVSATMTSRLHWAQTAGVGAALRPFSGLTLAADFSKSSWAGAYLEDVPDGVLLTPLETTPTGESVAPGFANRNFFDLAAASQTTTADTSEWRTGAEYLLSLPKVVVPLRAGIFRSRSPIRELGSGESRRIDGFTVGSGLNFRRLVFDVAFERRRSEGLVGLTFRGGTASAGGESVEKVKESRIVASILYRFPDNDAVKRLLRSVFVGGDTASK
jgi:long-subunit fatty acid transport protein